MPRLLPRQEPPAVLPPEPPLVDALVDALVCDGVDAGYAWRARVRAANAARQRAEAQRLAALYRAEVLADGRRLWTCGPAADDGDDGVE